MMTVRWCTLVLLVWLTACDSADPSEARVRHPELEQTQEQVRRTIEKEIGQWRDALAAARIPEEEAVAYARLGQVYLAHNFVEAAADALSRATALEQREPQWMYYYASALERVFRFEDAEVAYSAALELADLPEIRFARARVRHRLGRSDGAFSDLETLRANMSQVDGDATDIAVPGSLAAWLALEAELLVLRGQPEQAVSRLTEALALQPQATALYVPAARLSSVLGNQREAQRLLGKAGTDLPHAAEPLMDALLSLSRGAQFYLERGREWMQTRNYQQAAQDFAAAADIAPGDFDIRLSFARALEIVGQVDEAETQYLEALTIQADSAVAHYFLASLYERQQRDDESVRHYRQALAGDATYLPPRLSLAHALFRAGDYAESLQHYATVARARESDLEAHYYAGLAALASGDCDAAPEWFDQAASVNTHSLDAQEGMARSYATCSSDPAELSRAQDIAERLEEQRPDAAAAATLAMVHAALNDFDVAKRYQNLAIRRTAEDQREGQQDRLRLYESGERARAAWLPDDPVFVPPRLTMRVR